MKKYISLAVNNQFLENFGASIILIALAVPQFVLGQTVSLKNPLCHDPSNPQGKCINTLPDFIRELIGIALIIGVPVVTLGIIYSGFLFVKAQGNPQELTKAKDALLWTAIGGGILLGAWTIALVIGRTVEQF